MEMVEEVVPLRDRVLEVLRPRDSEELIDEEAFEVSERLPYWAELWPSGVALARALDGAGLQGRRVLELGCGGLALPSIAAALGGARVCATDCEEDGLALARENAARNDAEVTFERVEWGSPEALVARAPWDLVLASDVLYEVRNVDELVLLLPELIDQRGEIWIADPDRAQLPWFLERASDIFTWWEIRDEATPRVTVFRMRLI